MTISFLNKISFRLLIILFSTFSHFVVANDFSGLKFITEEYPPYNYTENGEPKGIAVDLLLNATKAAGSPVLKSDIEVTAWARGYNMALSGPNVVLFSTTRTEERENLFKWVGPIAEIRIVLIAKKSSGIKISDPKQINQTVGVVREDVGDQLVKAAEIPDNMVNRTTKPEGVAKMLISDRVKMWAYPEVTAFSFLEAAGENPDDYEVVHVLKSSHLYFAFSKDVSDAMTQKLQSGIDSLK